MVSICSSSCKHAPAWMERHGVKAATCLKVLKGAACVQDGVVVQQLQVPGLQVVVHAEQVGGSQLIHQVHGSNLSRGQAGHLWVALGCCNEASGIDCAEESLQAALGFEWGFWSGVCAGGGSDNTFRWRAAAALNMNRAPQATQIPKDPGGEAGPFWGTLGCYCRAPTIYHVQKSAQQSAWTDRSTPEHYVPGD